MADDYRTLDNGLRVPAVSPVGSGGTVLLDNFERLDEWEGRRRYEHVQASPSSTWTIGHNLGRYPSSVTIIVGGEIVMPSVSHPDTSTTVITFGAPGPAAGRAILS